MHAGSASSPVFPGRDLLVCVPLGSTVYDTVLLLYLERVTHPCSPLSSFFLHFGKWSWWRFHWRKGGAAGRGKASFVTGNSARNGSSYYEVLLWRDSSRDELHGQCESQQSSAGKPFWQKEEFVKQENKTRKHFSHCRAVITPRSGRAGQCLERGDFISLLGKGKTSQPKIP